ncbi:MAG: hypothetical protein MUC87_02790 [Bacteroidia bacterium]|jgi:hypothetical protein|nr:hypothetical protein [Bacteroidia bacterium]
MTNQIPFCPPNPNPDNATSAKPMLDAWIAFLAANPELQGVRALKFDMQDVQNLGDKAVAFRVYFGIRTKNDGSTQFDGMVVGVDSNGNDIVNASDPTATGIWDFAQPCPTVCDQSNSPMLNPDSVTCS